MGTKKENIAEAKKMLQALGLKPEDLLEKVKKPPKKIPNFLDIKKIKGVPCIYLRYNKETLKHEWLCLEVPDTPRMPWEEGRKWCQSKGGDYGKIRILEFISNRRDEINKVLKAKGYPVIEKGGCWSTECSNDYSWVLDMTNGSTGNNNKIYGYYVRAVVLTK